MFVFFLGPGPSIFRRRGSRQNSLTDTSIADMIEKFNKKRVEQNFVNNLMKKRRESMHTLSADRHRKSVASMWDDISAAKSDVLNIELEHEHGDGYESPNEDNFDENSTSSMLKSNNLLQRRNTSRKSVYVVPNDKLLHFEKEPNPQNISYSSVSTNRPKPSYVPIRQDQITRRHSLSTVPDNRTKRAANLWGLVREKALGPDDLKTLRERSIVQENKTEIENISRHTKTDDEKLQEQKVLLNASATEKSEYYIDEEHRNWSESPKINKQAGDRRRQNKALHITEKTTKNKTETHKKAHNGHISNTKHQTKQQSLKVDKHVSSRPKSAKGRVRRRNPSNEKTCKGDKAVDKTPKHVSVEVVIRDDKMPRVVVESDDDASLNNYLHSEISENDNAVENSDIKLSCFDLNIDDSFSDQRRPSERMSILSDLHTNDGGQSGEDSPRSRKDSVNSRHSTSSKKSSQTFKKKSSKESEIDEEHKNDELWDDVRRCRYLRGYDPPEMVMPSNVNVFVFGKDENDIIEERRQEKLLELGYCEEEVCEEANDDSEKESF